MIGMRNGWHNNQLLLIAPTSQRSDVRRSDCTFIYCFTIFFIINFYIYPEIKTMRANVIALRITKFQTNWLLQNSKNELRFAPSLSLLNETKLALETSACGPIEH